MEDERTIRRRTPVVLPMGHWGMAACISVSVLRRLFYLASPFPSCHSVLRCHSRRVLSWLQPAPAPAPAPVSRCTWFDSIFHSFVGSNSGIRPTPPFVAPAQSERHIIWYHRDARRQLEPSVKVWVKGTLSLSLLDSSSPSSAFETRLLDIGPCILRPIVLYSPHIDQFSRRNGRLFISFIFCCPPICTHCTRYAP